MQVELSFTGLNSFGGVAVDTAGDVYVTQHGNGSTRSVMADGSEGSRLTVYSPLMTEN
jgi:hypothetical protein